MKCQAVTRDGDGHITVKRSDGKVKTLSPLPVVYHPSGQVILPLATTAISWKKEAEISRGSGYLEDGVRDRRIARRNPQGTAVT